MFARDPDALIDLVELELTEELIKARSEKAAAKIYQQALQEKALDYYQHEVTLDDLESRYQMQQHFDKAIKDIMVKQPYLEAVKKAQHEVEIATAWRVEGTLREFAKFQPVNMWFSYPIHTLDTVGVLADIQLEDNNPTWKKNINKAEKTKKKTAEEKQEKLINAIQVLDDGIEPVSIDAVVEYFSTEDKPVSEKTVRRWVKNTGQFEIEKGKILPKNDD